MNIRVILAITSANLATVLCVGGQRTLSWPNERYLLFSETTHAISFDYDSKTDTVLFYIDRDGAGMRAQVKPQYLETLAETRGSVIHPDSLGVLREMLEHVRSGAESGVVECRADYCGRGYAWYRTNLFVVNDESGS